MSKINTATEKQILLDKMALDRRELADAVTRATTQTRTSKGWASTTALAAGALAGWPKFLRKPLRAMAAVSLKDRLNEILTSRMRNRGHVLPTDPELARLSQLTADLRHAVEHAAATEEVERIRRELDEQVHRMRELKALDAIARVPAVVGSVEETIVAARVDSEPAVDVAPVKAPPSGY